MEGNGEKPSEELQQKRAAVKQKAFEDELGRLDQFTEQRAVELLKAYRSGEEQTFQQRLSQAKSDRQRDEEALRKHEGELFKRFDDEGRKRVETKRRAAEEQKRREEEERRRQEALARQKALEEERKRQEEEQKRREEEAKIKAEEERRRREEELRRQEEDRQKKQEADRERKEKEKIRQEEERQERVKTLLANAQASFSSGDFEHALVEVAKALVNDPANVEALALESRIKEAQGKPAPAVVQEEEKPRQRKRRPAKAITRAPVEKKRTGAPLILALVLLVVVVTVVVIIQVRKSIFAPPATFAVMPWLSSSAILEEKIIGSSLAEEVSRRFEYLKPVTVMGYSSAYELSQHTTEPRRGAFQLGYFYALDGLVRQTGDTISVSLELVDSLGRTAWGHQFVKRSGNLAELAYEASSQLAEALHIQVGSESGSFLDRPAAIAGDAYLMYLRAEEMVHRKTPESLQNAYALLMQATQQDPRFAGAYAAASGILVTERERGWNMTDSAVVSAKHLAEAAVDANGSLADGYCARGRALALTKDYKEALADFAAALKLAPNDGHSYLEKGKVLLKIGKYNDAVDALLQAFKYDPRDLDVLEYSAIVNELVHTPRQGIWYYETALALVDDSTGFLVGPFADIVTSDPDLVLTHSARVISACDRRLEADPNDYYSLYQLARLKQVMGKFEEAGILLKKLSTVLQGVLRQHPKDSRAMMYLALTMTRLGKFPEAEALARRALDLDPRNPEIDYLAARMYALQMYSKKKGTDEKKKADGLKALRQAITLDYRLAEVVNPDFFNMYDLPEFRSLIQEPM